jgi:hypothetical protein
VQLLSFRHRHKFVCVVWRHTVPLCVALKRSPLNNVNLSCWCRHARCRSNYNIG